MLKKHDVKLMLKKFKMPKIWLILTVVILEVYIYGINIELERKIKYLSSFKHFVQFEKKYIK